MPEDRTLDLILDVDTGLDDALALLLACRAPGVTVQAITCVDGNVGVDLVVRNTLAVLDAAGASPVPVARGCARPLVTATPNAAGFHGPSGLGSIELPESRREVAPVPAVELLRRTLAEAPRPVTVVALAPLTNIATLLTAYPRLGGKIARLVVMGGSAAAGGNDSPAAEFNFLHDPEAADIVLRSGLDILLYGLDVFYDLTVDARQIAALCASTDPAGRLAGLITGELRQRIGGGPAPLGDAGAVAAAVWPDLVSAEPRPAVVELHGRYTRGASVVDRRHSALWDPSWPLVDIAWEIDAAACRQRFLDAVTGRG